MTAKPAAAPAAAQPLELARAEQLIDLVTRKGPALLAAGITSLRLGDLEFELGPPPPPASAAAKPARPAPRSHIDPLRDPSTYPAGRVPGFTRDEDEEQPGGRRTHE